ncbi:hypothetical protein DM860_017687 [Cuscuta australis]|uniref:Uncharacterized protein n=1 Tax=Cuscuta australis TaxID=267555 RepID=A0A328D9M8_9ASTE|nr:hypothetical protein DM860_017687 [Cuscuta australis]
MDVWFVAAVAAAGYISWKDLLRGKKSFVDSPRETSGELKHNSSQDAPQAFDNTRETFDDGNVSYMEKELGGSLSEQKLQGYKGRAQLSVHQEMSFYGHRTGKNRRRTIKPLTSLENCLVAHLIQERSEMEEYIFGSVSLHPTPIPFLVTDGSAVISRSSGESCGMQVGNELDKLQKGIIIPQEKTIYGVPQLPNFLSADVQRKARASKKGRVRIFQNSRRKMNCKHHHPRGLSSEAFLLSLGMHVVFFSSVLAHKKEIEKLNHILKQTNYLVQDLQDELEMKESLTVKELAPEDYESEYIRIDAYNNDRLRSLSPQQNSNKTSSEYYAEECDYKHRYDEEPMSKIAAELEVELERLEQNMNSTPMAGRYTEPIELDPGFVLDSVGDEYAYDRMEGAHSGEYNHEGENSTPPSANYAVSPRELTLRLHEVIESQLQERVRELEAALENSQRKARCIEEEEEEEEEEAIHSWRELSGSPEYLDLNIDGGTVVDAYIETSHDELSTRIKSEEDEIQMPRDHDDLYQIQLPRHHDDLYQSRMNDVGGGDDDDGDGDDGDGDEMDKLLEHIVERARKIGYPAKFCAQRALLPIDENER